jgi:competence protein CoiA
MQLYAFDAEQRVVFAQHAVKQKDYFCLECSQIVRRRGGNHFHTHYYHLASTNSCRLNGKSMEHLQVQSVLHALLPVGECQLEYRFPVIDRIADVVWLPQKLVFEIQCSPITSHEVQSRNCNYNSIGFHVIWILHDKRFNQWRLTAAEHYLQQSSSPCYYTNIDNEGMGVIYDQFELISKEIRKKTLLPLPVNLKQPEWLSDDKEIENPSHFIELPKSIFSRLKKWPVCFSGDILHESLFAQRNQHINEYLNQARGLERTIDQSTESPENLLGILEHFFYICIVRPYRLLFQIILERACK